MGNNLKGKVAVVTGSGQGIGRGIAIELAKEGAKVVTNNRKPNSTDSTILLGEYSIDSLPKENKEQLLKDLADMTGDAKTTADAINKLGGEAIPFFGDVADFKTAGKLIQTAVDNFGSIDILVNVAGTFRYGKIWDMSEETWDAVTLNKPKSYFNTMRHATPYMMKKKWGRIINCSSVAWLGIAMDNTNYCAANAGVVALTESASRELYPYGITCNAFTPEAMTRATVTILERWKKQAEAGQNVDTARFDDFRKTPGPEYVAPFVAYLATEEAKNITCTVFNLAGSHIGLWSAPEEIKSMDKKEGPWTVDELIKATPVDLLKGYNNPVEKPSPQDQVRQTH